MARHILVILDTYGRSDYVLARVRPLALHCHSTVYLLMVATPGQAPGSATSLLSTTAPPDLYTQQYLHEVAACLQQDGIEVRVVIRCGEPVETILAVAGEVQADVIAMTMPWRNSAAGPETTNVTEQVIRLASLPVLVERPQVRVMRLKRSS
jgi:nucleotide-binding universal stress UspA family protein